MRASRRLPLTIAALAIAGGVLSGCTGLPGLGGCEPAFDDGRASELVTADGRIGRQPDVDFPTPLVAATPERTVLESGEGEPIATGDVVDLEFSVLSGRTGELLGASQYTDDGGARFTIGTTAMALGEALACATPGSRVAVAAPAAAVYGEGGLAASGIADDETLIFVVDIERSWLGKANGFNQIPDDGMPTVVTAVDGTPGVVVPGNPPPTEARVSTIKAGGGAAVEEDDVIVLHSSQFSWPSEAGRSPSVVSSTWGQTPENYTVANDSAFGEDVADALVGATVGSQLLVVVPGEDGGASIYVLDILGIVSED